MTLLKAIWQFTSYLFWPRWGRHKAVALCLLPLCHISAQEYCGTTGLLAVPTAEMADAGTFRAGAFFLNDHFTPDKMTCDGKKYNTGGYFISIAPWSWMELSYACTLLKYHKNKDKNEPAGYYNEDRRLGLKLRPLKEGKWWPALAVGADDVEQFVEKWMNHNGGTYFHNAYLVASKYFDIRGHELSAHVGYRYFFKEQNRERRGVAGGIAYVPRLGESLRGERSWLQRPRFIVEWDGACVNVGADCLLWRHLFVQAGLTNGKYFAGGLAYHYRIPF